jgi:phosphoglycolate phosphatase
VLFDFDLTLADSTRAAEECIRYALRGMGLVPGGSDRIRRTVGLSLEATLESLTGETDPDLRAEFRSRFVEKADRVMVEGTEMIDGVVLGVDALLERGIRLGIVSTKYRYRIEAILDRWGTRDRFDVIVGGEDTKTHKPDPEGLRVALLSLGVSPVESVYVGDHLVDAEAASLVPLPFVGVLTGTTTEEDFLAFPHVKVLDSASELPSLLDGIGVWPPKGAFPEPSPDGIE